MEEDGEWVFMEAREKNEVGLLKIVGVKLLVQNCFRVEMIKEFLFFINNI